MTGALLHCQVSYGPSAVAPTAIPAPGPAQSQSKELSRDPRKGRLQLLVSVDWEGGDLREENLRAFEDLRGRFPQVRLVHFLNAAYYRTGASFAAITATTRRVLRPGDELGLHLHGWRTLFQASGVTFRPGPRFNIREPLVVDGPECAYDCGIDVPIGLYTSDELRKVVRYSIAMLASQGFGRAKSFRTGGWMLRQSVRDAIAAEGITRDHSDVATTFLAYKLQGSLLWGWLQELWPNTTDIAQPYVLPTSTTPLIEVPDNGALAGYTNAAQMVEMFQHNKAVYLADPSKNVVLSFGFHQELSKRDLPDLMGGLQKIYEVCAAENLPLESVTSEMIEARSSLSLASNL